MIKVIDFLSSDQELKYSFQIVRIMHNIVLARERLTEEDFRRLPILTQILSKEHNLYTDDMYMLVSAIIQKIKYDKNTIAFVMELIEAGMATNSQENIGKALLLYQQILIMIKINGICVEDVTNWEYMWNVTKYMHQERGYGIRLAGRIVCCWLITQTLMETNSLPSILQCAEECLSGQIPYNVYIYANAVKILIFEERIRNMEDVVKAVRIGIRLLEQLLEYQHEP